MKKEFFNKKNILVLIAIVLIITVMVLIIVFNPFGKKKDDNKPSSKNYDNVLKKKVNTKDDLIKVLEAAASKYYEENYYLTITEPETELKLHSEFGIKLSLSALNSIQPFTESLTNSLKKYGCNLDTSKIVIYPTKPYEKTDYTTNTTLYCTEFE